MKLRCFLIWTLEQQWGLYNAASLLQFLSNHLLNTTRLIRFDDHKKCIKRGPFTAPRANEPFEPNEPSTPTENRRQMAIFNKILFVVALALIYLTTAQASPLKATHVENKKMEKSTVSQEITCCGTRLSRYLCFILRPLNCSWSSVK